jgi:hypothetical protein
LRTPEDANYTTLPLKVTDLRLFPTDREAKAWLDAGAALGDEFAWDT